MGQGLDIKWRYVFGIAGVESGERRVARVYFFTLQSIVLLIAFWLPFQRFLALEGWINPPAQFVLFWVFWGIFLLEFLGCFILTRERWHYLFCNWLSILILLVAFPILWGNGAYVGVLHLLRVVVLIFMILPWSDTVAHYFSFNRLLITLCLIVIISIISGLFVSFSDPDMGGPWQGIWWAFQTITTVGYGDVVPDSFLGRILAIIFMLLGIGFLAVLSASFTVHFIYRGKRSRVAKSEVDDVLKEVKEVNKRLASMEQQMEGTPPQSSSDTPKDSGDAKVKDDDDDADNKPPDDDSELPVDKMY